MKIRYILFLLVLGAFTSRSQTISNPSFEANSFTVSPGYVSGNSAITGWTASNPSWIGINYAADAPFANNGAIPNGTNVAFIQSHTNYNSLSTTISGLTVGATYQVSFRANCRSGYSAPLPIWSLNGGPYVSFTASPYVGGSSPYYTNTGVFTATATTAALILANNDTLTDTTVLLDNFLIAAFPIVTTTAAAGVAATNATLNGTIDPVGATATNWFLYGLTTNYGSYTATNTISAGTSTQAVSSVIKGLAPGTVYHFKLTARNSVGTSLGADQTFTTTAAVPAPGTFAVTALSATTAAFAGSVNPNGAATTVYVQYGLTTSYGSLGVLTNLVATNISLSVSNVVAGLMPATTYHAQIVSSNNAGTVVGSDLVFTTSNAVPTVATLAATGIAAMSATLNGTVNPNGAVTAAWFRYGLTTSYGSYTTTNILTAGNTTVSVSNLAGGLQPNTTYHYELVGSNTFGTVLGGDQTFLTPPAAPVLGTVTATAISATNAVFVASVNPEGADTTIYFQYGVDTNYGSDSDTNLVTAANGFSLVSIVGTDLAPATTYHVQVVTINSAGTTLGSDLIFTTFNSAPFAATLAATSITTNNATLNGTVNPNGTISTAWFQYGLTTNYGSYTATNTLLATNTFLSVSGLAGGLLLGTTYHYELVGGNSFGTVLGGDQTFVAAAIAPVLGAVSATAISSNNAAFVASVNPGGAATTVYFQYGLTTNYGSYSVTDNLTATNAFLSLSNGVASLRSGANYHVQIICSNNVGITLGTDLVFTTPATALSLVTLPANNISLAGATINGTVNPAGAATTTYFEYGGDTSYGNVGAFVFWPATSATFTMPGMVVSSLTGPAGTNWTISTAPSGNWQALASSSDGTRLIAAINGGGIYISTNSGSNWMLSSAPSGNWSALASSADGNSLAAVIDGGGIYVSTNAGGTWTPSPAPTASWQAIASSADGSHLVAAIDGGGIYASANGGGIWNLSLAPATNWSAIACSADGSRLIAGVNGGSIYTSTNSGTTWAVAAALVGTWQSVASSANGLRLMAAVYGGGIYTSVNGGASWLLSGSGNQSWWSVTSSADGIRMAAAAFYGGIYTSTNGGSNWRASTVPTSLWWSIVSSADGTRLAAAIYGGGGIYTSAGSVSNLAPATTYHYQLAGVNATGSGLGGDLTFVTPSTAPSVATLAANGLSTNAATINGSVNPNGADTTVYFQYGPTTGYGSTTVPTVLGATNVALAVSNAISGLLPGAQYHFQLVSSNFAGVIFGSDVSFTTVGIIPVVTTLAAAPVNTESAMLNGMVDPDGVTTTAYFEYGPDTNYGYATGFVILPAVNSIFMPGALISSLNSPAGALWTEASAPTTNVWRGMASSADGTQLAAVNSNNGGIYTSTNSGAAWTLSSAPLINWIGIASSADGSRLTAVAYANGIYTSTNGGVNWTAANTNHYGWEAIASSVDGMRLAAAYYGSGIYTSTNGGATWVVSGAPSAIWQAVASSADGTRLAAGANGIGIYTSTNGGGTWALSGSPVADWNSVASSGDGTRLVAGEVGGGVYVSTNGGGTWTAASVPSGNWYATTASLDGTHLAAAPNSGNVYTSTNGGATWAVSGSPTTGWFSLASSADGTRLAGGANVGGIYTSAGATNSLVPNTTYHFQLVGVSSLGTVLGGDLALTTATALPVVTTLAATAISTNAAILNGTVNPSNSVASVYFQFGLTTNYGSYTTTNLLVATNGPLAVASVITNLPLGTPIHFQLAAVNSAGTSFGADMVFLTVGTAPTVTTLAATGVTATNATLNGSVNPNGVVTTAYFQYGLDTNYGDIGALVALPAPNSTYLPAFLMTAISGAAGAQWTQSSAPNTNLWRGMASSADGTRLAAVVASNGGIYTSTNSGGAWTLSSAPITNWIGIASSADGTRLAATAISTGIFTSTNGGANWTEANTNRFNWEGIASSADGTRLAAVVFGNGIYISTNGGTTWVNSGAANANWQAVASSSDGMRLAAGGNGTGIDTSTNGGGTWFLSGAPTNNWLSLASSGDGTRLVAGLAFSGTTNGIYVSTNAGAIWSMHSLSSGNCYGLASSFDGSRLAAAINGGGIYASTNGGATWAASSAPNTSWYALASSADGTRLAAGANGTAGIYISTGSSSGVLPATTYHFQLVGVNALGTVLGGDQTFTTSVYGPAAVTLPASGLAIGTATLNATVNPSGLATTAYFQFGLTTNYGSFTTTNLLAAASTPYSVTNQITNLGIGMPYHFQIVAVNSAGVTFGADSVFISMGASPTVTTLAATGVTAANATLNGSVDPNGPVTAAYFQYGLDTNYGDIGGLVVLPATNFTFSTAFFLTSVSGAAGAQWTVSSLPTTNAWRGLASSADGTQLAAAAGNVGGIYISTNSGGAWTLSSAPLTNWLGIASSADGTRLAAVAGSIGIFTSTNGGANWTEANTNRFNWTAIASSADGTRLVAVPNGGGIYVSTNGGGNWVNSGAPSINWVSVASSADGMRLAAGANSTNVYVSTNGGGTWAQSGSPIASWNSLASSGDGTRLVAGAGGGGLYVSTNAGGTWAAASVPNGSWYSAAASFDGTRLAAAVVNGGVYTSTNAGATWAISGSPNAGWYSLASSADGSRLIGGVNSGGVYISAGATTPLLPDTTYHYQLVGVNNLGTGLGGDLTFTTPNGPPVMATLAATGIGATNATLNATVNAGNLATTAWFQYGVTTNYTSFSATNLFAATNGTVPLSSLVAGFLPATVWHFQIVGANSAGTSFGNDLMFTSAIAPPLAVTLAASAVTITNAALSGTVNPNGPSTIAYYQYGVDTNYGDVTAFTVLPATNTALAMPGLVVSSITGAAGAQWTQSGAPAESWFALSSSSDGTHLAALVDGGGIYTSPDGGNTWTLSSAPFASWQAIASSSDGSRLAAAVYGGGIYTSINGGGTWTLSSAIATNNWQALASSADGARLAAVVYGGGIYLSTNSGTTWIKSSPGNSSFQAVSSSADGTHIVAVVNGGSSYASTNSGANWSTSLPNLSWRSVADSADGTHLAAVATGGGIFVSTNSGFNWTQSSAPNRPWWSIASSADGSRLAAAVFGGGIYTSTNSGLTWAQSGAPSVYWWALASSADGTRLAAAISGDGGIYTSIGPVSNLLPSTTYHYQLVGVNSVGTGLGGDMTFTTLRSLAVNFTVSGGLLFAGNGAFQLTFNNNSGLGFTVLATTNLALPLTNWTVLGPALETPPGSGNYQFTDPSNTNAAEFYRVTSP